MLGVLIFHEIYCLLYLLRFACSKNCKSCHSLFDGCLPLLRSQIKSSLLEKDWISIIKLPNFDHCINLFHRRTKHTNLLRFFKFLKEELNKPDSGDDKWRWCEKPCLSFWGSSHTPWWLSINCLGHAGLVFKKMNKIKCRHQHQHQQHHKQH